MEWTFTASTPRLLPCCLRRRGRGNWWLERVPYLLFGVLRVFSYTRFEFFIPCCGSLPNHYRTSAAAALPATTATAPPPSIPRLPGHVARGGSGGFLPAIESSHVLIPTADAGVGAGGGGHAQPINWHGARAGVPWWSCCKAPTPELYSNTM